MRGLKILLSTLIVYVVVAVSCSHEPGVVTRSILGTPSIMAPVPEASAQSGATAAPVPPVSPPAAPTVITTTCDKTFLSPTGSVQHYYAEAEFPGKTLTDLTRVVVLARPVAIAGYDWATMGFSHVKDGYAAYYCGNSVTVLPTEVRFVLP
jgi:hypothetical protein